MFCFCISLFILPCFAQTSGSQAINLKTETFFECLTLSLPDNLKRTSTPSIEEWSDYIYYASEDDSVQVKITKKDGITIHGY